MLIITDDVSKYEVCVAREKQVHQGYGKFAVLTLGRGYHQWEVKMVGYIRVEIEDPYPFAVLAQAIVNETVDTASDHEIRNRASREDIDQCYVNVM